MRVLVVHASQFGSTEGIVERISEALVERGVRAESYPVAQLSNLDGANAVVIGSAIHAGHWLDDATRFVYRHQDELRQVPVWLFSSGPLGDRAVRSPQPDPKEIGAFRVLIKPRGHAVFAGAYDRGTADFRQSGLIERVVVSRLMPDGDWRDWEAIDFWAEGIATALLGKAVPA